MLATDQPLIEAFDAIVLDLDGVVYVGERAVAHATDSLKRAAGSGAHLAYVTNNAARTPGAVVAHLQELDVPVAERDVVTSAQAAASILAAELPAGSHVYLIGGDGLDAALREKGLVPVTSAGDDPVAVVQGYGPEMPWKQVVAGAILVAQGLPWVASNTDGTIPTELGIGPGNGALVDLVARFSRREPVVAGKPAAPLFRETETRIGARRPLMVGDRLDTDIEGANAAGWASLLVMTGVSDLAELVAAAAHSRPAFIAGDLRGLLEPHPQVEVEGKTVRCGGWSVRVDSQLAVEGQGSQTAWWRAVAVAAWAHLDRVGEPVDVSGLRPGSAR